MYYTTKQQKKQYYFIKLIVNFYCKNLQKNTIILISIILLTNFVLIRNALLPSYRPWQHVAFTLFKIMFLFGYIDLSLRSNLRSVCECWHTSPINRSLRIFEDALLVRKSGRLVPTFE